MAAGPPSSPERDSAKPGPDGPGAAGRVLPGRPCVLVVDDHESNRAVAKAFCEALGCECETARDGVEAVEAASARSYDFILMDVMMPRMDGRDATRTIRQLDGPAASVPIIGVTANADPEDVRACLESGMDVVFAKPIDLKRLAETMARMLHGSPAGARLQAAR